MGDIVIDADWSPEVRGAAAAVRRELAASSRELDLRLKRGADEEGALLVRCAEEALAFTGLLLRLGQGPGRPRAATRDALVLELRAHEQESDASISFFRALEAVRGGTPLEEALSREGRLRTADRSEAAREERVGALRDALADMRSDPGGGAVDLPWERREPSRGAGSATVRLKGASKLEMLQRRLAALVAEAVGDV